MRTNKKKRKEEETTATHLCLFTVSSETAITKKKKPHG